MIQKRNKARTAGLISLAEELQKHIIKLRRRDRRREILNSVANDLDVKDRWLGIRGLKKHFPPRRFEKRDIRGTLQPLHRHAEITAEYLSQVQWGDADKEPLPACRYPPKYSHSLAHQTGQLRRGTHHYDRTVQYHTQCEAGQGPRP